MLKVKANEKLQKIGTLPVRPFFFIEIFPLVFLDKVAD